MPKAAFTLTWSAASGTYACSGEPGGEVLSLVPDSPAWFAWLAERSSFAFHGQACSYTARLGSLYRKLNVHSREQALTEAVRLHLL